jgi:hypothetical protein
MAAWIPIILAIIGDVPEISAVIQKWIALGQTPTVEDLQAELAAIEGADERLADAYSRLYPGQTPPQ